MGTGSSTAARTTPSTSPVSGSALPSSSRLSWPIRQWRKRFAAPSWRKRLLKITLIPRYLFSEDFRLAFVSGVSANTICFERELLDHFRMVYERV